MFPYQITNGGVVVFIDGEPLSFARSHSMYDSIVAGINAGDEDVVRLHTSVRDAIVSMTEGKVKIEGDKITVNGRIINGPIVERILSMIAMESKAVKGFVKFLDRLYDNCSKSVIDNVFNFLEACDLPITVDGCFLAYKYVNSDFTDCHTGTFDNSVGATPSMPRNECNDDNSVTCSSGLHVCSLAYVEGMLSSNSYNIIVCKVAPEDVVAVPKDYNNSKMRTCRYEVVSVLGNGEKIEPYFSGDTVTEESIDNDLKNLVEMIFARGEEASLLPIILDAFITVEGESLIDVLERCIRLIGPNRDVIQEFIDTMIVDDPDIDVMVLNHSDTGSFDGVLLIVTDEEPRTVMFDVEPTNPVKSDLAWDMDALAAAGKAGGKAAGKAPPLLSSMLESSIKLIGPNSRALETFIEVSVSEYKNAKMSISKDATGKVDGVHIMVYGEQVVFVSFDEPDKHTNTVDPTDNPTKPPTNTVKAVKPNGRSKLTVDQVRSIKASKASYEAGDITLTSIGKEYGVHREQIARIFRGETWKHIT